MRRNIGTTDRVFRLLIALLLLFYAIWQHSWIAALFGIFVLYEALAGWCLLYQLINKNTCPLHSDKSQEDHSSK